SEGRLRPPLYSNDRAHAAWDAFPSQIRRELARAGELDVRSIRDLNRSSDVVEFGVATIALPSEELHHRVLPVIRCVRGIVGGVQCCLDRIRHVLPGYVRHHDFRARELARGARKAVDGPWQELRGGDACAVVIRPNPEGWQTRLALRKRRVVPE